MRMIVLLVLAATACAPQAGPAEGTAAAGNVSEAAPTPDPFRACDGSKANALLDRMVDATVQAEAKRLVGAGPVRVIAPGMAVTMDYRGDRLNIDTDAANKAVRFYCG